MLDSLSFLHSSPPVFSSANTINPSFLCIFIEKSFPLVFKSEHMLYLSLLNDIDYKTKIYFGLEKLEYSY